MDLLFDDAWDLGQLAALGAPSGGAAAGSTAGAVSYSGAGVPAPAQQTASNDPGAKRLSAKLPEVGEDKTWVEKAPASPEEED